MIVKRFTESTKYNDKKVLVFNLPTDIDEKNKIVNYFLNKDFTQRKLSSDGLIVRNVENANIFYVLLEVNAFILINEERGLDAFVRMNLLNGGGVFSSDDVEVLDDYSKLYNFMG